MYPEPPQPIADDGSLESLSGENHTVEHTESGEFIIDPWDITTSQVTTNTSGVAAVVAPLVDRFSKTVFSEPHLSAAEIAKETTKLYRAEIQQLKQLCADLKRLQAQAERDWESMDPDAILATEKTITNERFALKAQINTLMSVVIPDMLSLLEKAGIITFAFNRELNATTSEQIPIKFGGDNSLLTVSRTGDIGNEYAIKRDQKTADESSRNSIYMHADDKTGALLFALYRQTPGSPQNILHLIGPHAAEDTHDTELIKMGLCITQMTERLVEKLESSRDGNR